MDTPQGLKRAGTLGELRATGEALLAKEALVEGVVEVLDRAARVPQFVGIWG